MSTAYLRTIYAEVYELENDSGWLVKDRKGQWFNLDREGRVVK